MGVDEGRMRGIFLVARSATASIFRRAWSNRPSDLKSLPFCSSCATHRMF